MISNYVCCSSPNLSLWYLHATLVVNQLNQFFDHVGKKIHFLIKKILKSFSNNMSSQLITLFKEMYLLNCFLYLIVLELRIGSTLPSRGIFFSTLINFYVRKDTPIKIRCILVRRLSPCKPDNMKYNIVLKYRMIFVSSVCIIRTREHLFLSGDAISTKPTSLYSKWIHSRTVR